MPFPLSDRVQRIKPSPTLAVAAKAQALKAAGEPIINLGIGEPDFDTPHHIKEAAIDAIHKGYTKYTAVGGIAPLCEAIIHKLATFNHLDYTQDEVIVSCGGKHSLYNLFSAIINPGDEVIIPSPYWVSYPDMTLLTDGVPVIINATFESKYKLTADALEKAITKRTRLFILNSPSNPTGISYSKEELKQLGEVLMRHPEIFIVCDDIYEQNLWQHMPFTTLLNVCPELKDRTVIANSMSKTYAMTGWRIGYATGPKHIITAMKNAQSQNTSNPTTIAQYAALAALTGDQSCVQEMTKAYQARHEFVFKALQTMPGFECHPSDGTFYSFPRVTKLLESSKTIKTDLDFGAFLLSEAKVAILPGSAFGAPNHIRISYAASLSDLETALRNMKQAIEKMT